MARPIKYKVKRNQVWKKKDTGSLVIINKKTGDYWSTSRIGKKSAHHISDKDLRLFYTPVYIEKKKNM